MSVSILAVDDEVDVADLFRQHFRREVRQGQYVLHFACSAAEALDKLARGIEPELIVMLSDINMPGMDGLTLLREVKERRPDLPVIMVTAYGDEERRRRAKEYGAVFFITEPVDFDFLKAQLRWLTVSPATARRCAGASATPSTMCSSTEQRGGHGRAINTFVPSSPARSTTRQRAQMRP